MMALGASYERNRTELFGHSFGGLMATYNVRAT